MGLVGVGAFVLFAVMSLSLVVLGAGGEVLMLAFAFVAVLSSIALDRVIKHYVARDERREREMTLKLR
jgi:hypothetical protein